MTRYKFGDLVLLDNPQRIIRIDMIRTYSGGTYTEYEGLDAFYSGEDWKRRWNRIVFKQEAILRIATETDIALVKIKSL